MKSDASLTNTLQVIPSGFRDGMGFDSDGKPIRGDSMKPWTVAILSRMEFLRPHDDADISNKNEYMNRFPTFGCLM